MEASMTNSILTEITTSSSQSPFWMILLTIFDWINCNLNILLVSFVVMTWLSGTCDYLTYCFVILMKAIIGDTDLKWFWVTFLKWEPFEKPFRSIVPEISAWCNSWDIRTDFSESFFWSDAWMMRSAGCPGLGTARGSIPPSAMSLILKIFQFFVCKSVNQIKSVVIRSTTERRNHFLGKTSLSLRKRRWEEFGKIIYFIGNQVKKIFRMAHLADLNDSDDHRHEGNSKDGIYDQ